MIQMHKIKCIIKLSLWCLAKKKKQLILLCFCPSQKVLAHDFCNCCPAQDMFLQLLPKSAFEQHYQNIVNTVKLHCLSFSNRLSIFLLRYINGFLFFVLLCLHKQDMVFRCISPKSFLIKQLLFLWLLLLNQRCFFPYSHIGAARNFWLDRRLTDML